MLGKASKRLQKQLEENGKRASATVVDIAEKGIAVTRGQAGPVGNTEIARKTRLKVTPEDEPEFEVAKRFSFNQMSVPDVGDVVGVVYDPSDHDKIIIDQSPEAQGAAMLSSAGIDPSLSTGDPQLDELQILEKGGQLPSDAPPQVDPVEQLEKLTELKEKGALTDAEFETQKARILGQ
jgi:putative oligomerization/nucleic acid binding protein